MPKPGYQENDQAEYEKLGCQPGPDAIAVHCYGEVISNSFQTDGTLRFLSSLHLMPIVLVI